MEKHFKFFLTAALAAFIAAACGTGSVPQSADAKVESTQASTPPPVNATKSDKARMELFVMSQCPFGTRAESVVAKVLENLGQYVDLSLRFVVDETGGANQFSSLHGDPEVRLDRVQACAGIVDPSKQLAFIVESNESQESWEQAAAKMELDVKAINACLTDGRGDKALSADARRCKEMNVNASPSLYINGKEYKGAISTLDIFEAICAHLSDAMPVECDEAPGDFTRETQGSSSCSPDGALPPVDPAVVDETPFEHTIIKAAGAFSDNIEDVNEQTQKVYPNATIRTITSDSAEAKKLIAKYEIKWLPAYIFPKSIENLKNFDRFRGIMVPLGDPAQAYMLDPVRIGCNYNLTRPMEKGRIEIFYTPFSPKALTVLADILDVLNENKKSNQKIILRPAGIVAEGDNVAGQYGGFPEVEEMERHIAIYKLHPEKLPAYIKARKENPSGSYWEDFCAAAGLDPAKVKKEARSEATKKKLYENSKLYFEVNGTPEISFLVSNVEIARVVDIDDFKRLMAHVSEGK